MAEIIAKLGLNDERFTQGLNRAGSNFTRWGRGLTRQAADAAGIAGEEFSKKFSVKQQFSALAVALGMSIQDIAGKVAEAFTGGAQEDWKEGLRAAEEASRIIEESTLRRMNTVRQIAEIEKQIVRRHADENPTPKDTPNFFSSALLKLGQGMAGTTGGMVATMAGKVLGKETEAQAFARSQKTQLANRIDAERVAQLKEKEANDQARIAAARADLARAEMDDVQKAVSLQDDMIAAYDKAAEAILKGRDATELHLAAITKQRQLVDLLNSIEKKQAEEEKKRSAEREAQLEKEGRARETFLSRYRAYLDALDHVKDAQSDARDARHDALAFTVDQAAAGERGNAVDRTKAKAIQRDESRARRLFDSGATVTEFDSKTQRNVSLRAADFMARAKAMREDFGKLTTSEKNPMASLEKRIDETNKHLAAMERALTPTNPARGK